MSDAIKNLAEKRAALLTDASGIVAEHAEKGEALTVEAQNRFDALTAEAAVINSAISSEKIAVEARAAADVARAEKAVAFAPATDATRNLSAELRRIARDGGEVELRDVTKATFTQAVEQGDRFWITAGQVNPFVDPSVVTVLQVAKGNVIALPRTTALGTAAAVNEGSAIGESDGTNSSLSLTPVKYASLLQVGIETLQLSLISKLASLHSLLKRLLFRRISLLRRCHCLCVVLLHSSVLRLLRGLTLSKVLPNRLIACLLILQSGIKCR
jgi:HK97 family phage major capsid protein